MRGILTVVIASLALGSGALAEEYTRWDFRVTIDKDGEGTIGGKALDDQALDEAIAAAAKEATGERLRIPDLHVEISCDGETPFAAFRRVFDSAVRARVYLFRVTIGGEFVDFALVKDRGLAPNAPSEPQVLRTVLCSTGDAADHSKDRESHVGRLTGEEVSPRTWIWVEGESGGPIEVSEDPEAVSRAAQTMCTAADGPAHPLLEIDADPNSAMRHLYALLARLSPHGARSVAEDERMRKSGEPIETSFGPPFRFTGRGAGKR